VVCCEPGKEPSGLIKGALVTVSVLRKELISSAVCTEKHCLFAQDMVAFFVTIRTYSSKNFK
jgi:hypothetical protein